MSTDTPSSSRGLSPFLRPFSRRGSKSPAPEESDPRTGGELLVPKPTHRSTDSASSRSSRSNGSRGRKTLKGIKDLVTRSPSRFVPPPGLGEADFKEVVGWLQGFSKYNQLVTNHVTKKDSGYPLEEFSKMCDILTQRCTGNFIQGLPEALFDLALLWCPAQEIYRKEIGTETPSWSWIGWEGRVNFPFDPTSSPDIRNLVRDEDSESKFFKSEVVNFWIGPKSALQSELYTIRREKHKRLRIQYPPWLHAPWGYDSTTESNTLHFNAYTIPVQDFGLKQLHVDGKTIPDTKKAHIPASELFDKDGKQCGVIMDYKGPLEVSPSVSQPFEFVLLSRNRRCTRDLSTTYPSTSIAHPPNTPIWDGERFIRDLEIKDFDDTVYPNEEWKMLNVLLIQWEDDVAERVAVGRIHEDAWNARNPVKKDIILK